MYRQHHRQPAAMAFTGRIFITICRKRASMSRESSFTPKSGDEIFVEEWYCDSKGHVKMTGGYGCSIMIDKTQKIEWECDQSKKLRLPVLPH